MATRSGAARLRDPPIKPLRRQSNTPARMASANGMKRRSMSAPGEGDERRTTGRGIGQDRAARLKGLEQCACPGTRSEVLPPRVPVLRHHPQHIAFLVRSTIMTMGRDDARLLERLADADRALRLEWLSLAWMATEAAVAIGAGVAAHSLVLEAFGADRVIELASQSLSPSRCRSSCPGCSPTCWPRRWSSCDRAPTPRASSSSASLPALLPKFCLSVVRWPVRSRLTAFSGM